jgi:hypothetical protein
MVGKVINPVDLLMVGRIQVQLPSIDSLDLSPWARVAQPMAGIFNGNYSIPNIGDEVLLAFEHGDINAPVIIGSVWNTIWRPPMPTPLPQIRAIRTLVGNQIVFTEAPPSVTIQSGPTPPVTMPMPPTPAGPATIFLTSTPPGILIMAGLNVINMTPDGITISAPNINLFGTAAVNISAPNINLLGTTAVNIGAPPASVNIKGGLVTIN